MNAILFLSLTLGGGGLLPNVAAAQAVTAITGATVIDGNGGQPLEKAVVILRGSRIDVVGPRSTAIPRGARVVRLDGMYLVPGFIDMHAHPAFGPLVADSSGTAGKRFRVPYDDDASREMTRTLLGFGITTIRNPAGSAVHAVALRDAVRLGKLAGPRMFTAGEAIDRTGWEGLTTAVETEADVRAEVARQAALGVDYIKLYASLTPPLVRVGIEEAHRHRIKAIAHLLVTTWTDAANAGVDGIVHVVPGSAALLPAARRAEYQKRFRGSQFMVEWFDYVDYESPEYSAMVKALLEHNVTIDPTLVVFEAMARGNDTAITRNPDLVYAPPVLLENWRRDFRFDQGWKPEDYPNVQRIWPKVLTFVKRLYDAGVHLTVGTDVPNPWIPPGASFHRELELLVAAGIEPSKVLRMATRSGAEALGIATEVGTISPGKLADLIVLERNPLEQITNSRSIRWVVQAGRWWRPAELMPKRRRPA